MAASTGTSVEVSPTPVWTKGLSEAGLNYYDGVVEEERLHEILELHKRDTVSTFGTRSSRRVSQGEKGPSFKVGSFV